MWCIFRQHHPCIIYTQVFKHVFEFHSKGSSIAMVPTSLLQIKIVTTLKKTFFALPKITVFFSPAVKMHKKVFYSINWFDERFLFSYTNKKG